MEVINYGQANRRLCVDKFKLATLKEKERNLAEQSQGKHVGYNFLSVGTTIFPDSGIEGEYQSIDENFVPAVTIHPKTTAGSYNLLITACVRYVDPQSNKDHYTVRSYQLFGIIPDDPKSSIYTLRLDAPEIPMDSLSLRAGEAQYAD